MSALAIAVGTDGIIVACDGVCYTYETGAVSGFVSKIILLPEYGAFIGWTGAGAFGPALRFEINQSVYSFDDLVEQFGRIAEELHWKLFGIDRSPLTEVSCVIAGWSEERQAYEAYRVVSYEKPSVNYSDGSSEKLVPFEPKRLPGMIWCSYSPEKMGEFGIDWADNGEEAIDTLIRLVCASRADSGWIKDADGCDGRFYMAGGFVQVAVLQGCSAQTWVAHRWPEDVIGEPIDPEKGARLPDWLEKKK